MALNDDGTPVTPLGNSDETIPLSTVKGLEVNGHTHTAERVLLGLRDPATGQWARDLQSSDFGPASGFRIAPVSVPQGEAAAIPATPLPGRRRLTILNVRPEDGSPGVTVWIGTTNAVTNATGFPLVPGAVWELAVSAAVTVYAFALDGAGDLRIAEEAA